MICIETQHFSLNRYFLLALGLWPYQRSYLVRCQFILLFGILISFTVFQLTTFITAEECTTNLFTNVVCSILCFVPFMIKYISFYINAQNLKYLLEQCQHICNELKDENEIAIIEKYGCDGKRYTTNIMLLTVCSLLLVIVQSILPHIIDVFTFINESRSRGKTFVETEYFVDRDKYYYLILLHTDVAICTGVIVFAATGTMLLVLHKHACGMFSIASYRLEQMITTDKNNLMNKIMMEESIIRAVDIHRKAIEYSGILISSFEGSFFLLIAFCVLCLTFNLFRIFKILPLMGNIEELCTRVLSTMCIIIYMFLTNYAGQEITDHYESIYFTAYNNVRWYTTPLHVQKTILFLLQRGSKTFGFHVGGLFVASLGSFATLASTSVSYFTVMYSTQK